jgi:hypothetical protein
MLPARDFDCGGVDQNPTCPLTLQRRVHPAVDCDVAWEASLELCSVVLPP